MALAHLTGLAGSAGAFAAIAFLLIAIRKGWVVPMHVYEAERKRYDAAGAAYRMLHAAKTTAAAVDPRRLLRRWQREDLADWDRRFARYTRRNPGNRMGGG